MVAIRFIPKHPQQTDYIRDIQGIYTKIGWQRKLTIEMKAIKSLTRQRRNEHSGTNLEMNYEQGNSNSTTKSISATKHTRRGNIDDQRVGWQSQQGCRWARSAPAQSVARPRGGRHGAGERSRSARRQLLAAPQPAAGGRWACSRPARALWAHTRHEHAPASAASQHPTARAQVGAQQARMGARPAQRRLAAVGRRWARCGRAPGTSADDRHQPPVGAWAGA